jgi:hypothetical protein
MKTSGEIEVHTVALLRGTHRGTTYRYTPWHYLQVHTVALLRGPCSVSRLGPSTHG